MYSLLERLRSLRHAFGYGVSERIAWRRGAFEETPARDLSIPDRVLAERIAALRTRYQVQFESSLNASSSFNNYEYLDLLDRGWQESALQRPQGGVLYDVGCASFWYAATLQAFFQPHRLVGVDVEGYRLFRDGRTRRDYAEGYLMTVPNGRFLIADYSRHEAPADVITAWFPFLTATAILGWRLPLSLLSPGRLMQQISHNLAPGGLFLMVNHGPEEFQIAIQLCVAAGLRAEAHWQDERRLLAARGRPAVLSWWRPQ
jgi:SAM-dependent methyltransferase